MKCRHGVTGPCTYCARHDFTRRELRDLREAVEILKAQVARLQLQLGLKEARTDER